jgi:hypothetical protein
VLAALVLSSLACAIAADSSSTLIATRRMDRATRLADELLLSLDAPIQEWLRTVAPSAVLPPEAEEPRFAVLHDALALGEFDAVVTITAFDQCGMPPGGVAGSASQLAATLPPEVPPEVESLLAEIERSDEDPFGLDAIAIDKEQSGWRVYPVADESDPLYFGDAPHGPRPSAQGPREPALGSIIATHNDPSRINVNTAPRKLLEAAMREAGCGGIEAILEARARGEATSFASRASARDTQQSITLVSRSDTWSFRIDIHIGPVTRSWWCVYQSSECVQRLVIPE